LQNVMLDNFLNTGKVFLDEFLAAISQNHSIHTVRLNKTVCSASALEKLMERKIQWEFSDCYIIGHPVNRDDCTSYVEELEVDIDNDDLSVIEFMSSFRSWPRLRRLEIRGMQHVHNLQHVEKIFLGAPNLQGLTLHQFDFRDPAVLKSLATVACNAPAADLKWHLNFCKFHPNTIAVLEEIVTWKTLKSLCVSFEVRNVDHCKVLQAIMSESSYVGHLHVKCVSQRGHLGDSDLALKEVLQALQKQPFSSAYPPMSLEFDIDTADVEQYHGIIETIPQWTPRVKKLRMRFNVDDLVNRRHICSKLADAVRNDMHFRSIFIMFAYCVFDKFFLDSDEEEDNEEENQYHKCRLLLDRYEERNRKVQDMLKNALSIPWYIWPYIYHLASRGGADKLFRLLHQNIGYMGESWQCPPPKRHKRLAHDCPESGHGPPKKPSKVRT